MRIVIELPDATENSSLQTLMEYDVIRVMSDALEEFIRVRIPVSEYVVKKYGDRYTERYLNEMKESISERITWAALFKAGKIRLEK